MFDASKEFQGKKVVLVSVPGAFTPGCQAMHIPPFIENINKISEKGVDMVVVIASNDAWVMYASLNTLYHCLNDPLMFCFGRAAWAKVNGVDGDSKIKFMCDKEQYSKKIDWMAGMGDRNARWAMIIEKDGTISYAERETKPGTVTVRCPVLAPS